jgi:hypothetical protein
MGYTPEVGHVVVFADTYDNTSEYRVNAVEGNRAVFSLVDPPEGYGSVDVNMSLAMAEEMGVTQVGSEVPSKDEIDALAVLLALATVEFLEKLEFAQMTNALFGPEVAMLLFPLDELVEDFTALSVMAAVIDAMYEASDTATEDRPKVPDFAAAEREYAEAFDTSRGL